MEVDPPAPAPAATTAPHAAAAALRRRPGAPSTPPRAPINSATAHMGLTEAWQAWDACSFDRMLNGWVATPPWRRPPLAGGARADDLRLRPSPCSFCFLMHGVTQVVSLLAWSTLPASERFQRLLSIALCLALAALPTFACSWYSRRRTITLIVVRLAYFSFPLLRKPRGAVQ